MLYLTTFFTILPHRRSLPSAELQKERNLPTRRCIHGRLCVEEGTPPEQVGSLKPYLNPSTRLPRPIRPNDNSLTNAIIRSTSSSAHTWLVCFQFEMNLIPDRVGTRMYRRNIFATLT